MCIIIIIGGFMENIISINNMTFRYNDKFIFDKFSLNIKKGEWISITGPNGSGKSTLIKLITGILYSDNISVFNLNLNKKNIFNIRRRIGVIFDNIDNMFLCETVEDDLAFTLENLCFSHNEIRRRINNISNELNITHLLKKDINSLSGGEKSKVALACALIHEPDILILDESLSMIDENDRNNILSILSSKHKKGLTIISIIHNLRESYLSDRLLVLNNGEIMLDGSPFKVMEYDKILNRLGIELPFEIELSIKLKLYGLIDEIIPDVEKMVNTLWE